MYFSAIPLLIDQPAYCLSVLAFSLVDFSVRPVCLRIYGLNGLASSALILSLSSLDIVVDGSIIENNFGKNTFLYSLYISYRPLIVSRFLPLLCLLKLTKIGELGLFLLGWSDNQSLMYGID